MLFLLILFAPKGEMSTKEETVTVPLEMLLLNDLFRKHTLDQNIYDMAKKDYRRGKNKG